MVCTFISSLVILVVFAGKVVVAYNNSLVERVAERVAENCDVGWQSGWNT